MSVGKCFQFRRRGPRRAGNEPDEIASMGRLDQGLSPPAQTHNGCIDHDYPLLARSLVLRERRSQSRITNAGLKPAPTYTFQPKSLRYSAAHYRLRANRWRRTTMLLKGRGFYTTLCLLISLITLNVPLFAQNTSGSITGVVQDASGAVIP